MTRPIDADAAGATDAPPVYTLISDAEERDRLRRQTLELRAHALTVLDGVGFGEDGAGRGRRALDLGCGPVGIIELLSERVGPEGRVTGLDFDATNVDMARAAATERGLGNVDVLQGDARRTGLPDASFDLVHGRLLLVCIPDPELVVAEMARLVRPGGWVAAQEADVVPVCYPPSRAVERLGEVFLTTWALDRADFNIGRRLPELFRRAGLEDIHVEARADLHRSTDSRRSVMIDLVRSMRPKIVARGLMSEEELEALDREARAHLDDRNTLTIPHLLFLAWARRPA